MKSLIKRITIAKQKSPPSRGAWIEIDDNDSIPQVRAVTPLAGGVD